MRKISIRFLVSMALVIGLLSMSATLLYLNQLNIEVADARWKVTKALTESVTR